MLKERKKNGLILALDIMNYKRAVEIAEVTSEYLDAVKIGLPIILLTPTIVHDVKKAVELPIIGDLKIADIPDIARKVARKSFDIGMDAITVHGFVGPATIEACLEEAKEEKDVIVITQMTHPDAELFLGKVAEDIVVIAKECGATGIQAPGNNLDAVRKFRQLIGKNMIMMCCGMGTQGGKIGTALEAGADFEIVGRTIYLSPNPKMAAKKIHKQIQGALKKL